MRIVTSSIIKNSNSGRGKGGVDDKFTDLQNLQFNHICAGHVIWSSKKSNNGGMGGLLILSGILTDYPTPISDENAYDLEIRYP